MELTRRFALLPIRTAAQLKATHAMINKLIRVLQNKLTPGQDQYLEVPGDLTSNYEDAPMDPELADVTGLDLHKHLMDASDMPQTERATLLGIGPAAVSMILSGDENHRRPRPQSWSAVCGEAGTVLMMNVRRLRGLRGAQQRWISPLLFPTTTLREESTCKSSNCDCAIMRPIWTLS